MERLKVVVVGCGQIADGHVSEIQKLDCAVVVGVCDSEAIIAEQLAARLGIANHYSSFERMLDREKPDVVHICTPPASHLPLARTAVDAGCHLYVEKPLAMNHAQSVELAEYVAKGGKKLTIGHNSQFEAPTLELRELLQKKELGEPVHVESWYGYNLEGSFGKAILGSPDHWVHGLPGKLFHNNLNHMLNKITELLDDERPEVRAMAWRSGNLGHYGDLRDDLHDELRTMIRGRKVSAYGTFSSSVRPVGHYLRVYGTKSIVDLDYTSRVVAVDRGVRYPSAVGRLLAGYDKAWQYARSALKNTDRFRRYDYHYFSGMGLLIRRFYDSILKGTPLPVPVQSMLTIAWIMDEIFRQTGGRES